MPRRRSAQTSSASASSPQVTSTCVCRHKSESHFLARCGCPNDRPTDHPMHTMDDAFHRVWCSDCLGFCSQDPNCSKVFITTTKPYHHIYLFLFRIKLAAITFLAFLLQRWKAWRLPFLARTSPRTA